MKKNEKIYGIVTIHLFRGIYDESIDKLLIMKDSPNETFLNMRRSSPPYKKKPKVFLVGWNVGERKPHQA